MVSNASLLILSISLSSRQIIPFDYLERQGMNFLKAADCAFASLNLSTTTLTEVPKSPLGKSGATKRKSFSFFPMAARLIHRCLSVATRAAIERPMAAAVCLVVRRARSVAALQLPQETILCPHPAQSFSRSALLACSITMVCNAPPA